MLSKLFFWTGLPLREAEKLLGSAGPVQGHDVIKTVHRFVSEVQWNPSSCDWSFLLETSGTPFQCFGKREFTLYKPGKKWLVKGDPAWVLRGGKRAPNFNAKAFEKWMGRGKVISPMGGMYMAPNVTALKKDTLQEDHRPQNVDGVIERNASSWVRETAANTVINGLTSSRIGWPVFCVCDSNSFHNLSFIMASYAFANTPQPRAHKLILNFDAHTDIGGTQNYVGSDNWGGCMMRLGRTQAYLVIGVKGQYLTLLHQGTGPSKPDSSFRGLLLKKVLTRDSNDTNWCLKTANVKNVLELVWAKLSRNPGGFNLSNCDVYVSIDRDFIKSNFTMWGDKNAKYTREEGYSVVSKVLTEVLGERGGRARLVGFDVTGVAIVLTDGACLLLVEGGGSPKALAYTPQGMIELKIELEKWHDLVAGFVG